MSKRLRIALFKLIDILVIFTMVSASPMSMTAAALAQDSSAALATEKSDYAPGESAHVTGSGLRPAITFSRSMVLMCSGARSVLMAMETSPQTRPRWVLPEATKSERMPPPGAAIGAKRLWQAALSL